MKVNFYQIYWAHGCHERKQEGIVERLQNSHIWKSLYLHVEELHTKNDSNTGTAYRFKLSQNKYKSL